MAGPQDMILPMPREIRPENKALHGATAERLGVIERRLKKLENARISYRQALTADSLMGRLPTGEFEERIEALEKEVGEMEGRK